MKQVLLKYIVKSFEKQNKEFIVNSHHVTICQWLEQVLIGKKRNIIIAVPPRHGKTQIVQSFLEFIYGNFPHSNTIYTSYSQTLATSVSANIRDAIGSDWYQEMFPGIGLKADTQAKDRWSTFAEDTPNRIGSFRAVAAGGQITGHGAGTTGTGFGGLIVMDDTLKPLDARSDTIRSGVNDWYSNTLYSRLNSPDTPQILIMQRLHEQDLVGYLLEKNSEYDNWELLSLPAINEDGTALWSDVMPIERLRAMEMMDPLAFRTQYMQEPVAFEGTLFKRDNIKYHDDDLKAITGEKFSQLPCYIGTDFAVTEGKGDYTVFSVMAVDKENNMYLIDQYRARTTPDKWAKELASMVLQHNPKEIFVEKGGILNATQNTIKAEMNRNGQHATITPIGRLKDKVTSAQTFLGEFNLGNFYILADKEWTSPFVSELLAFSETCKHDDAVDSVALVYMNFKRIISSNFPKEKSIAFNLGYNFT